jgi:hypothetical protein
MGLVAGKPLLECGFLIPTRRDKNLSDGRLHSTDAWAWLEDQLFEFGGASRATSLYEGWYLDPDTGEQVRDVSRKYVVAVPRRKLGRLRALLREACRVFQQKCLYLSVAGQVEFIKGVADEPT